MKHFLSLLAIAISFSALAQNPNYDPDSNGDDLIGAEDLQSFLAVYNTMLTSSQTVVGYVTDLDSAGTFDPAWSSEDYTYYSVPDSVDFLCFPPGEEGEVFVVLNSNTRKTLTTTCTNFHTVLNQDSIIKVQSSYNSLYGWPYDHIVTWLYVDGRWWPH
jgi:hypothetical protein